MRSELFYGTGKLARFLLRRDRRQISIWLLAILLLTLAVAYSFPGLYPTEPERQILAETMKNPAVIAMVGPAYGADNYHYGPMLAHQLLLFTGVAVAIMSILLVTRHTRKDEEEGRLEVVRSLPVGRLAPVSASLLVVSGVNLLLALLVGVGLASSGIETVDLAGSLLYGAALGAIGLVFTAATALIAQLTETARGSLGLSFAFLGGMYLLRAVGDLGSEAAALISPLGLALRTQSYVGNFWWPIGVLMLLGLLLAACALYLNSVRDLEAGLIAARPGRDRAKPGLLSAWGLALRLQRTSIIGWSFTMFLLGASYGSVFGDIEAFFNTSEMMQLLLPMTEGYSLTEQFTAVLIMVLSLISAIPALLMVLKLRNEERAGRTHQLLAGALPRRHVLGSYLLLAVLVTFVMQLLTSVGFWSAAAAVMEQPMALGGVAKAAVAYVPAILVLVGLAVLLIGLRPGAVNLVWLYLGYSFFVLYLGGLLQLPSWTEKLTPFGQVPELPVDTWSWGSFLTMVAVACVLVWVGVRGYEERDIEG